MIKKYYLVLILFIKTTIITISKSDSTKEDIINTALASIDKKVKEINELSNEAYDFKSANSSFLHNLVPTIPYYISENSLESIDFMNNAWDRILKIENNARFA